MRPETLDLFARVRDIGQRRAAELKARDEVLDRLAASRATLIEIASRIARRLCQEQGQVTSTDVFREMRDDYRELMADVDPRWMGAVFRKRGWRCLGYRQDGSHGRPVPIWTEASQ